MVKKLGVLAICQHCKDIRISDEPLAWLSENDDIIVYEKFLSEYYKNLSHGICEDCMKKYYPETN